MLRDLLQKNQSPEESQALEEELFQKLMERAKELDEEQARLFEELELKPEEVIDIVDNRLIFTPEQWEEILAQFEAQRPEWQSIRSAEEIRKARQGLSEVQRGWLFVK